MTKSFYSWYKKYISDCNNSYIAFVKNLSEKVKVNKSQYEKLIEIRAKYFNPALENSLDKKISENSEELGNLELKLEKAKSIKQGMDESLLENSAKKVYKKIVNHPKIDKVTTDKHTLNIYTKELKVKEHNIGSYKLTYLLLNNKISIKNLEYIVDGQYDHWHVFEGRPCLSQWQPILSRQLDTFQIFLFIDTLIHYLLLSDSTNAYMSFEGWIKKFELKEKIDKKSETEQTQSGQISAGTMRMSNEVWDSDTITVTYNSTWSTWYPTSTTVS